MTYNNFTENKLTKFRIVQTIKMSATERGEHCLRSSDILAPYKLAYYYYYYY